MKTDAEIFYDVIEELAHARTKFPSSIHCVLAMAEESGELVRACLELHYGKGSLSQVRKEAIQTMAMCIRIIEEGDHSLCGFGPEVKL